MGFDGIYSVYKRNQNTKQYEKLAFYDKNGKELYNPLPSRDDMLNQLLLGYNRHGFEFEAIGARRGLPEWYIDMLKVEHSDWFNDDVYTYSVDEDTYYDYLELKGWATGSTCEYDDWMADPLSVELDKDGDVISEVLPKRNPLKFFMEVVDAYLNAYGVYYPKPGEIIIICEMSY